MERLFRTHYVRKQECLDGTWEFQTTDEFALPVKYTDNMAVPACWEMSIPYCKYSGCAAYKRNIYIEQNSNIRLVFKGVSHTCKVYLDGEELGYHYSAFSAFSVIARNVTAGEHCLEVLVDNSYSEKSRLHITNDYFTYGGITRPTFLEYVKAGYVERTEFEPFFEGNKWHANVRVFVNNLDSDEKNGEVQICCAGTEMSLAGLLKGGQLTCLSGTMHFDEVIPWDTQNPHLYEIRHTLRIGEEVVDDLVDRIGFRTVSCHDGKVLLNGNPLFIKGVNRHEDHGSVGCAIPLQLMQTDISLIKDLGANAVRTSHYQNDERFLDLCDENGIVVWEESHDRGGDVQRLEHPLFIEQSMNSMHEMLEYHYNHPSIIMWGCLNEAASNDERGREIYKMHLDYLATDKSRPRTFASNKHTDDMCMDMVDICSMNMYPLWYDDATVEETLERIRKCLNNTGNGDKPLIISEYGAGGIYNFRDVMRVRWSEEYQADIMEQVTGELLSDKHIAGVFIWQFCDTRIKSTAKVQMRRPNSRNNKGLVDEFRRPKMAYYVVQEIFHTYTEAGC